MNNIFKIFGSSKTFENVDKKQNERDVITHKISEQQLFRETEDIKKWREALEAAESVNSPNRTPIQRVYNEAVLDPHLQAVINTRTNSVTVTEWKIYNDDGTEDEETTNLIDKDWFMAVRRGINQSLYYGYTLLQLGEIINDEFVSVDVVNRQNIVPEQKSVKKTQSVPSKEDLTSFDDKPYNAWTIWIDSKGLGLLNNCAPYAIYKKNASGFWNRYLQLFGMPFRVGKTDIADPKRRSNLGSMLKNSGSAGWMVMDKSDEMEFVQSSGSIGNPVYAENIKMANAEISKIILGQTMTTENGSSRSQSEVHERVGDIYTISDKLFEANIINKEVIPLLVFHGIIPAGKIFKHVLNENVDTVEKIKMIVDMTNSGYILDPAFVESFTGMTISGVKTDNQIQNEAFRNSMKRFYG